MYCPSCGKDNPETARFCRGCGKNLTGILQQTSTAEGSAFERIEYRLDEIIAGYASRYFKQRSGPFVAPASLKDSWKLLGQGYLTVIGDLLYTYLMVNFALQFRFLVLLFKSPVMWWRERRARKTSQSETPAPLSQEPLTRPLPSVSVTEGTTDLLSAPAPPPRERE